MKTPSVSLISLSEIPVCLVPALDLKDMDDQDAVMNRKDCPAI
jgi:hypothetical protein